MLCSNPYDAAPLCPTLQYNTLHHYASKHPARFADETTLRDPSYDWVIAGINYGNDTLSGQADGIALTPDRDWLYWCPNQGLNNYKAQTSQLRALLSDATGSVDVTTIGAKIAPAGGIVFSEDGLLYAGSNADPLLATYVSGRLFSSCDVVVV